MITILTITAGARAATPGFIEDFNSMTAHWHNQSDSATVISTGGVGGVGKEDIVLAFHAPYKRPYTGFAVD